MRFVENTFSASRIEVTLERSSPPCLLIIKQNVTKNFCSGVMSITKEMTLNADSLFQNFKIPESLQQYRTSINLRKQIYYSV